VQLWVLSCPKDGEVQVHLETWVRLLPEDNDKSCAFSLQWRRADGVCIAPLWH
jgi:hypothetical protein